MVDHLTPERRSWNMSRIRSKDTNPEISVRSVVHRMGLRFRLGGRGLPGRPDLVLPRHKVVIFVHGCFWHRHTKCKYAYNPKSRKAFWNRKFDQNVSRDNSNIRELKKRGWKVCVVWECETFSIEQLNKRLHQLLEGM